MTTDEKLALGNRAHHIEGVASDAAERCRALAAWQRGEGVKPELGVEAIPAMAMQAMSGWLQEAKSYGFEAVDVSEVELSEPAMREPEGMRDDLKRAYRYWRRQVDALDSEARFQEDSKHAVVQENGTSGAAQHAVETDARPGLSIDSAKWTGLPSGFVFSDDKRTRLIAALRQAEIDLDQLGAGNHEKAQARAFIVAARALADAPEPPVDVIWELIQRANSVAGIASLFVSLIALFGS